jgi:hypothetical protein
MQMQTLLWLFLGDLCAETSNSNISINFNRDK